MYCSRVRFKHSLSIKMCNAAALTVRQGLQHVAIHRMMSGQWLLLTSLDLNWAIRESNP